jgi:hypothetical protein
MLILGGLVLLGLHPQATIATLAAAAGFNGISRVAAHAYLDVQDSILCFWKSSHVFSALTCSNMKLSSSIKDK